MSDKARIDAIFATLADRFPGRMVKEITAGKGWTLAGSLPAVEFLDYTLQDIGAEPEDPDECAVHVYADGVLSFIGDHELPPPTRRPDSQAVRLARVISGISPQ